MPSGSATKPWASFDNNNNNTNNNNSNNNNNNIKNVNDNDNNSNSNDNNTDNSNSNSNTIIISKGRHGNEPTSGSTEHNNRSTAQKMERVNRGQGLTSKGEVILSQAKTFETQCCLREMIITRVQESA